MIVALLHVIRVGTFITVESRIIGGVGIIGGVDMVIINNRGVGLMRGVGRG